ncbi:acetoin reductase family protein [Auriscalpium vulgare]|uniref:Acetoin reductase family protein n=1 Tax=Auriscalpium vulgare TaxID=40419 RepID=A0ACB8RZM8_9AGAM|nr:acetoin reductase family protein [Auriscalpium vulgare]
MSTSSKGVALVTGAAQGIGQAIALRLASDGFDVAVNDISANKDGLSSVVQEIKATGRRGHQFIADISQEGQVVAMIEDVVKTLGGLDVFVANAGIAIMAPVAETDVEDFDRVLSVNVRGTFLGYKHAVRQMAKQGRGGRIIGASASAGKTGVAGISAYSASKFAIRGLTQSAAQEFGQIGITVNAYAPGFVKTAMHDAHEESIGLKEGELHDHVLKASALRRITEPEDVASLVSFLASKDGAIITGQTINVDGGKEFD